LSTFNFPQDTELLSKAGMNVYIAHNKKDLELFKVLTSIYSEPSPKIVSNEEEDLEVPAFITFNTWNSPYKVTMRTLLNKQYRYVIFKHDPVNPLNTLIITAPWDSVFDSFVSSFDEDQTQIGFVYLGEAGKEKLYAVILAPNSEDPSAVMIDFHLILDANGLKKFGIKDLRTFVANDKGDITIENLIAQSEENSQTLLYTERELPLGKDIVDAITNRKYKYLILKHDPKKDFTYVEKEGDWGSSYEDFVKDFTKKGGQLGLIYLDVEAKDMLVLIVYAPKLLGTQTLKEFGVSSDPEYLESLGIKPYIAHNKKDLELSKVLEGIHNEDAFYQNNPA